MVAKVTKLIVLLAVGLSCFTAMETASVSGTETTEPVTDGTTTESICSANSVDALCHPPPNGLRHCFVADDPTGCTPPRCVCGTGVSYLVCPREQCPPGALLYRPPIYLTCPRCVCLPKRCATCDPNNTTIPNFPECSCSTCQCIDGQCINNSTTTDFTTELLTTSV